MLLAAVRHLLAEEFLEKGIAVEERTALDDALGIDVDDGVFDLLDERREGELHFRARLRHGALLGHGGRHQREGHGKRGGKQNADMRHRLSLLRFRATIR